LTLDLLYPSDGWLRNSLENRLNNINRLEVYHEIRGNVIFLPSISRYCWPTLKYVFTVLI